MLLFPSALDGGCGKLVPASQRGVITGSLKQVSFFFFITATEMELEELVYLEKAQQRGDLHGNVNKW